jgi:hypothetical protein
MQPPFCCAAPAADHRFGSENLLNGQFTEDPPFAKHEMQPSGMKKNDLETSKSMNL